MSPKVAGSLTRIAGLVAIATVASKVMGLVRQLLIADIYGSGEAYSSHNIAYIVPGFLLVLLGGAQRAVSQRHRQRDEKAPGA